MVQHFKRMSTSEVDVHLSGRPSRSSTTDVNINRRTTKGMRNGRRRRLFRMNTFHNWIYILFMRYVCTEFKSLPFCLKWSRRRGGVKFSTDILQQYEARGDFMRLLLVKRVETKQQSALCKKNYYPENRKLEQIKLEEQASCFLNLLRFGELIFCSYRSNNEHRIYLTYLQNIREARGIKYLNYSRSRTIFFTMTTLPQRRQAPPSAYSTHPHHTPNNNCNDFVAKLLPWPPP